MVFDQARGNVRDWYSLSLLGNCEHGCKARTGLLTETKVEQLNVDAFTCSMTEIIQEVIVKGEDAYDSST